MIEDFEETVIQLKELSTVLNTFSSEAVQLKIVEMLFNPDSNELKSPELSKSAGSQKSKPKRNNKATSQKAKPTANGKKKPVAVGTGAKALISKLAEGEYFKTPKSMKTIIDHCEVNMARKIKQTDISGKLARMVRDGTLIRKKNADGQYEYSKP